MEFKSIRLKSIPFLTFITEFYEYGVTLKDGKGVKSLKNRIHDLDVCLLVTARGLQVTLSTISNSQYMVC